MIPSPFAIGGTEGAGVAAVGCQAKLNAAGLSGSEEGFLTALRSGSTLFVKILSLWV